MASLVGLFGDANIVSYLMRESPDGLFKDASTASTEERVSLFCTLNSVAFVYNDRDIHGILSADDFVTQHAECKGSSALFIVPFQSRDSLPRSTTGLVVTPTCLESSNHYHDLFTLLRDPMHHYRGSMPFNSVTGLPVLAPATDESKVPGEFRFRPSLQNLDNEVQALSSRWMATLERSRVDELFLDDLVTKLWVAFMMLLDAGELPKHKSTDIKGRMRSNIRSNRVHQTLHGFLCYLSGAFPVGLQSWHVYSDFRYHVGHLGNADMGGGDLIDHWVPISPDTIHEFSLEHGLRKSPDEMRNIIADLSVWPGNSLYLANIYKRTEVSEIYHRKRWWRKIRHRNLRGRHAQGFKYRSLLSWLHDYE